MPSKKINEENTNKQPTNVIFIHFLQRPKKQSFLARISDSSTKKKINLLLDNVLKLEQGEVASPWVYDQQVLDLILSLTTLCPPSSYILP